MIEKAKSETGSYRQLRRKRQEGGGSGCAAPVEKGHEERQRGCSWRVCFRHCLMPHAQHVLLWVLLRTQGACTARDGDHELKNACGESACDIASCPTRSMCSSGSS